MEFKFEFDKEHLKNLEELKKNDYDPYGGRFEVTKHSLEIRRDFEKLENSDVSVAGRIMARRDHGKLAFFDLSDEEGSIQIYIQTDALEGRSAGMLRYIDTGDIVGVFGTVTKTKAGEVSIRAKSITMLSKSLLPIPSKWYGLEDTEKRYRKRYLDFIMNPKSREKITKGSIILSAIRKLLESKGFMEVTVPLLQPIPGGTNAKPFVTHYNSLDRDFYLKIASELYLKRLLVGGFEKIFDISKNLRNEGIDTKHNPEFMAFELYQAYADLGDMIKITEEIVKTAVYAVNKTYSTNFNGHVIDFSKFQIKTMEDVVRERISDAPPATLLDMAKKINGKVNSYGEAINTLFEEHVEKSLIQPTFITKFPIEVSPLAKAIKDDPCFVYRFELYVGGMELANAFSELNDPLDQIKRFEEEASRKERGIDETQEFDRDFIEALGYGMPPAGGLGIGLDRLQMIATDSNSIKEVIAFPQIRTIENEET